MKKIALVIMTVFLMSGCTAPMVYSPSQPGDQQEYAPPPPADTSSQPWVGPGTPWVYYHGDWFLNGVLYYNFGPAYGWAPYYAYSSIYIVRPGLWYGHRWWAWYHGHPHYQRFFVLHHPYWRGHHEGFRYDRRFYDRYNRGQGRGWHGGFHRFREHDRYRQGFHHPGHNWQAGWGEHFRPQHMQRSNFHRPRMQQRSQMRHGGQRAQRSKKHQRKDR